MRQALNNLFQFQQKENKFQHSTLSVQTDQKVQVFSLKENLKRIINNLLSFFEEEEVEKNKKQKSVFFQDQLQKVQKKDEQFQFLVYEANNKSEDRNFNFELSQNNQKLNILGIFDGHGGSNLVEKINEAFPQYLRENVEKCYKKSEKEILNVNDLSKIFSKSFDQMECQLLEQARQQINVAGIQKDEKNKNEFWKQGSCGLVLAILDNKQIVVANAGDSMAILIKRDGSYQKLNKKFNTKSKKEQQRLKNIFPGEKDILVEKKNQGVFYLKNLLQPTRAFGDFRLKYEEFYKFLPSQVQQQQENEKQENNFQGPYLTHKPDIQIYEIFQQKKDENQQKILDENQNCSEEQENQEALILSASDGVWDHLSKKEVVRICLKFNFQIEIIQKKILQKIIEKVAYNHQITVQQVKEIPLGIRRNYHDDITIQILKIRQ